MGDVIPQYLNWKVVFSDADTLTFHHERVEFPQVVAAPAGKLLVQELVSLRVDFGQQHVLAALDADISTIILSRRALTDAETEDGDPVNQIGLADPDVVALYRSGKINTAATTVGISSSVTPVSIPLLDMGIGKIIPSTFIWINVARKNNSAPTGMPTDVVIGFRQRTVPEKELVGMLLSNQLITAS